MRVSAEPDKLDSAQFDEGSTGAPSILLFAAAPLASEIAAALRRELTPRVAIAGNLARCVASLRQEPFDLLLLEESVSALNPLTAEALYEAAGTTAVLEINFGIMRTERILLGTRSALRRRKLDLLQARVAARAALQNDLIASLTGLLLESQLALRQAGPGQAPALERLVGLAEHVCAQLRADDDRPL